MKNLAPKKITEECSCVFKTLHFECNTPGSSQTVRTQKSSTACYRDLVDTKPSRCPKPKSLIDRKPNRIPNEKPNRKPNEKPNRIPNEKLNRKNGPLTSCHVVVFYLGPICIVQRLPLTVSTARTVL